MRELGSRRKAWGLGWAVIAFLYAPLLVMAVFSFNDSEFTGLPFNGFTWRWYQMVLEDDRLLESVWNSVYVALGVVALSSLFGVPAAIALDRYEFPGKAWFGRLVLLPIVLPGVITGVALLLFYMLMKFKLSLYTIMLGQGTGLMCVTITEVSARLRRMGRSTEDAARMLGANEWEVLRKVTLPGIMPALLGAMLIAFSISFDEIAVTYLLTGRQNTLPMTLWSMLRREATPEVNAISTLVILVSIVLICIGTWLSRRGSGEPVAAPGHGV
jgi:spermidine/putrescine transport system permease protein